MRSPVHIPYRYDPSQIEFAVIDPCCAAVIVGGWRRSFGGVVAEAILIVDDEQSILDGMRRTLSRLYSITTASSGSDALAQIAASPPFAVIMSDMRMPQMSGAEFLARARLVSPDSVQLILSGQADLASTIDAVNNGKVFRFLTKPCSHDDLCQALDAALEQRRLVTAERELLQHTLDGVVDMLTELLAMTSPEAFSRGARLRSAMTRLAEHLGRSDDWELRLAATLSQIGCVALPPDVVERVSAKAASAADRALFATHPGVGESLLERIPRLERVAQYVGLQIDSPGACPPGLDPEALSALQAVVHLSERTDWVVDVRRGVREMRSSGRWPPAVLDGLDAVAELLIPVGEAIEIRTDELRSGMILDIDLHTSGGILLARRGASISAAMAARIANFANTSGLASTIKVIRPTAQ